jgi:DNA-directed RNA polymerase subunit K/omega
MSDYESDGDFRDDDFNENDEPDFAEDMMNTYYENDIRENGHEKDDEDVKEERIENALYTEGEETIEKDMEEKEEDEVEDESEDELPDKLKSKIVPRQLRKSSPVMTKFEYAYFISQRAFAIERNSPLMIPDTNFTSAIDIAREETERGLNPLIIQRVMPNGAIEEWKCSELRLYKSF